MDIEIVSKLVTGLLPALVFLLTAWALLAPKSARRSGRLWALGFLAVEVALQCWVLPSAMTPELMFTLLPLTCYLPAIVGLHILSRRPFAPTALGWMLALLCAQVVSALQKLLIRLFAQLSGVGRAAASLVLLTLASAGVVALVYWAVRKRFWACMDGGTEGWLALLPLPMMLLALYSYFLSATTDATVLLLLFLTALAAFAALIRLMDSLIEAHRAQEARLQVEALRQSYEMLQRKLELGRSYRHDMRHHMNALSALLEQDQNREARAYIAAWRGQMTQIETENWCKNPAVNAVLCAYIAQAKEQGCRVEAEVSLPGELAFEEVDVCMVLANALENAIHACRDCPEEARVIRLSALFTDQRRLSVQVVNPCAQPVTFDQRGLPAGPRRAGHGQGLKSVAAVAEKYQGLLQCGYEDGMFTLRVVLLDGGEVRRPQRKLGVALAGACLCLFAINCMPTLAQALEDVPVLGDVIRVVDLRTYSLGWGDSGISVEDPVLDGDGPAADDLTAKKDAFIKEMEGQFMAYVAQKHQGYVGLDMTYEVVRDDEALFVLRFDATVNVGGSVDEHRYFTLDKSTEKVLSLSDLFLPDVDYLFPVSREIKAQMAEQMKADEGIYFLPGEGWPEEDCFRSIDPQQNFYINGDDRLVIVFGEYEVAPGSMGAPEFVIPAEFLSGLLAQPSILK